MPSLSLLVASVCGLAQLAQLAYTNPLPDITSNTTSTTNGTVTTPSAWSSYTLEFIDNDVLKDSKDMLQRGYTHDAAEILRRLAEEKLTEGPWSVTNQTFTAPSGDKRDWFSYAPYWSPDPNCPTAKTEPEKCPYVNTDGVTNPDIYNLTSESDTEAMASAVKVLSMAFYLFDEEKYAARATEVLRMWFLNNQTRMNPNVNYGQIVRGTNSTHAGRKEGILSVRSLIDVPRAVEWLDNSKSWTKEDDDGIRTWFNEYYLWLVNNPIGKDAAHAKNNHESYYYTQVVTYEHFLLYQSNVTKTLRTFFTGDFLNETKADGNQTLETVRTLPFHYQCFSLTALVYLAQVGDQIDPSTKAPYYAEGWTANHTAIEKALWFTANFTNVEPGANRTELVVPMRAVLGRFNHTSEQEAMFSDLVEQLKEDELKLWPLYTASTTSNDAAFVYGLDEVEWRDEGKTLLRRYSLPAPPLVV